MLDWIEAHPGLAGWIQAFGTIVALGLAIGIPWIERRRGERQVAHLFRLPMRDCLATLWETSSYFRRDTHDAETLALIRAKLDKVLSNIQALPIDKLPPAGAHHLNAALEGYATIRDFLRPREQSPTVSFEHVWRKCRHCIEYLVKAHGAAPGICSKQDLAMADHNFSHDIGPHDRF